MLSFKLLSSSFFTSLDPMNSTDRITRPLSKQPDGPGQLIQPPPTWSEPPRKRRGGCCLSTLFISIILVLIVPAWIIINSSDRTNILVLGIDSREDTYIGRSDTIILTTFIPSEPYIGMLSIPRDLWVSIPEYGSNRINTAHFFAEAHQPGSGPYAAMETVRTNFGVDVDYYIRLHLIGFLDLIDALGGVDIDLPQPMSGYEAGTHHLNGEQALALVRDREGSDDFSRAERSQIFLTEVLKQLLSPSGWLKIPTAWKIISQYLDTNIPTWQFPQLAFALLRVGPGGVQSRVIGRESVVPFVSGGGAFVLEPKWDLINPVLLEMFGQ
jgi:LCP family protein required for cell wall assembly